MATIVLPSSGSGGSFTRPITPGIADADVATDAAIAGTKIDPDFGAQPVATEDSFQILAPSGDTHATYETQRTVATTDATATTIYSFVPPAGTSVSVWTSVEAILSDKSDDYRVDALASFLVSALGVVATRLALTKGGESMPTTFVIGGIAIDTSGGSIRVRVTGANAKDLGWKAVTTVVIQ